MANEFMAFGRQCICDGRISLLNDTLKVVAVTSSHTHNSAHQSLNDISSGNRLNTSAALSGKAVNSSGILTSSNASFSSTNAGTATQLYLYKEGTSASNSWLIAHYDTLTGLPAVFSAAGSGSINSASGWIQGILNVMNGNVNLISDNIKFAMIAQGYPYSSSHTVLNDASAYIMNTSSALIEKTAVSGIFKSRPDVFPRNPGGGKGHSYWLFRDTGDLTTSYLIQYYTHLPGTPVAFGAGENVEMIPNSSGWCSL